MPIKSPFQVKPYFLCICLILFIGQSGFTQLTIEDKIDTKMKVLYRDLQTGQRTQQDGINEALKVGGPAVPYLIKWIKDTDNKIYYPAFLGLQIMSAEDTEPIVLTLVTDLQDEDKRLDTLLALAAIGRSGNKFALPVLAKLLQSDEAVRRRVAITLQQISLKEGINWEQVAFKDRALRISIYVQALKDESPIIRMLAVNALLNEAILNNKKVLVKESSVTNHLIKVFLEDDDIQVREVSGDAIALMCQDIQAEMDDLTSSELDQSVKYLERASQSETTNSLTLQQIRGTLAAIKLKQQEKSSFHQVLAWVLRPYVLVPIIYLFLLLGTYYFYPLGLLWLNDSLLKPIADILPSRLGGKALKALQIGILTLQYRPRVLDAWVNKYIKTARQNFDKKDTVKSRAIYVSIPVILDGKTVSEISANDLRPVFEQNISRLLIWGEGGSGKTSLACQVAKWGMEEQPTQRLCSHRMLPVLIEEELNLKIAAGSRFFEAIRRQVQDLISAPNPIPTELLEKLLRYRRVLVIVDHFSEMSNETRGEIQPSDPNFAANALLVTSRIEESLNNKASIKQLRIEGNRLSSFMEAYLSSRGVADYFNDPEKFGAYQRLSLMVGKRNITVLLAKLYAEYVMIASKEKAQVESLPENIPELMLTYVNELNQGVKDNQISDRSVHRAVKLIAWECLKRTYRPISIDRNQIATRLGGEAESLINYLEDRLRIIQTVGAERDQIKFTLDPLAEYYAGLHLVGSYSSNDQLWRAFFIEMDKKVSKPESIKDFLLAVRDCSLARGEKEGIPAFVPIEFARRANQHDEQEAKRRLDFIQRHILVRMMLNNGSATKNEIAGELKDFSNMEINESIVSLTSKGWIIDDELLSFNATNEGVDYKKFVEIYLFILTGEIPIILLGCEYYDSYINEKLLLEVMIIQGDLPLIADEINESMKLLKYSPTALRRSLQPLSLFLGHRFQDNLKSNDLIDSMDRIYFMKVLADSLIEDFNNPVLQAYFFDTRGFRELSNLQELKLKTENGIAFKGEILQRQGIAILAEGDKRVSVLMPSDAPEPWEKEERDS